MQVFLTSPWVPAEWVRAHRLEPRGVWFEPDFVFEGLPLGAGVCAFAQAAVGLAARQSRSAVIFTTHCDQLRRGFDAVGTKACARVFLFNVPATSATPVARMIFCSELERLGRFLESVGGRPPEREELERLIGEHRSARHQLLEAATWCPAREYAEAIARFHWNGEVRLPPRPDPANNPPRVASAHEQADLGVVPESGGAIPVALVGGPFARAHWGLLATVESAGGRLVLNATEAGERSLWESTAPTSKDLPRPAPPSKLAPGGFHPADTSGSAGFQPASLPALALLAREYLDNCVDVFQRPNTRLYSWLGERLAARHVRGIVLWHYVGCDLWRAEVHSLREAFGLPVLALEPDETGGAVRARGRIEAFLESLR